MNRYELKELAPHERLLVACTRSCADEETLSAAKVALDYSSVDWRSVIEGSVRHGIAQSVSLNLRSLKGSTLPPFVRDFFERVWAGNERRNAVLLRSAGEFVSELASNGISSIILKGAALVLTVYSDPAIRNFNDVDVLVHEEDYHAAGRIAENLGYERMEFSYEHRALETLYFRDAGEDILSDTLAFGFDPTHTQERVKPHFRRINLEIHRGLFRNAVGTRLKFDLSAIWDGALNASLPDGTAIRVLDPAALLVHLAEHASEHVYGRLQYFMDVGEVVLVNGKELDWDRVVSLTNDWALAEYVFPMLDAARRYFEVEVPDEVLEALGGKHPRRLRLTQIVREVNATEVNRAVRRILRDPSGIRRLTAVIPVMFPPFTGMQTIYATRNPFLIGLLYIVRPFHLAGRAVAALARGKHE